MVSLGELTTIPWGKCRGLCIKSYSKRMRGDLTGMAAKKDEEFPWSDLDALPKKSGLPDESIQGKRLCS